jgi:hypothetical protein
VETLGDYDVIEEDAEELEEGDEQAIPLDPHQLAEEIAELEGYRKLALAIGKNQKGSELVKALPQALAEIEAKGGRHKAVIFTEWVRTQRYLADLLAESTGMKATLCFSTARTTILKA